MWVRNREGPPSPISLCLTGTSLVDLDLDPSNKSIHNLGRSVPCNGISDYLFVQSLISLLVRRYILDVGCVLPTTLTILSRSRCVFVDGPFLARSTRSAQNTPLFSTSLFLSRYSLHLCSHRLTIHYFHSLSRHLRYQHFPIVAGFRTSRRWCGEDREGKISILLVFVSSSGG